MKITYKITMLLTVVGATAIAVQLLRRMNTKRMRDQVATEGYETASDILYPDRNLGGKLHYGPVIPY